MLLSIFKLVLTLARSFELSETVYSFPICLSKYLGRRGCLGGSVVIRNPVAAWSDICGALIPFHLGEKTSLLGIARSRWWQSHLFSLTKLVSLLQDWLMSVDIGYFSLQRHTGGIWLFFKITWVKNWVLLPLGARAWYTACYPEHDNEDKYIHKGKSASQSTGSCRKRGDLIDVSLTLPVHGH